MSDAHKAVTAEMIRPRALPERIYNRLHDLISERGVVGVGSFTYVLIGNVGEGVSPLSDQDEPTISIGSILLTREEEAQLIKEVIGPMTERSLDASHTHYAQLKALAEKNASSTPVA